MNKRILGFSILALSLTLVGCGENNETSSNSEETAEETVDETTENTEAAGTSDTSTETTLTDSLGNEVVIPANPERIIASYLEDYLVALGVSPVAQWSISDGAGIQDYLQEDLQDIPTIPFDLPFEAVTSFSPDLLLVGSAETVGDGKYGQYSKIAPTYVVGTEDSENWREDLVEIAKVLNLNDEADQILEDYDAKAEESQDIIKDSIGEDSVAAVWLTGGQLFIVSETASSGAVMYGDLGLASPDVVKEISESATSDWSPISLEEVAQLDTEHLFLISSELDDSIELLEDPLWQNIPAVKNDQVYEYESTTSWLYNGPVANDQIIDDVLESLVE
ncbi:ABC transporter substrate-binding protein [Salipaludibacillus sp. CF4.18]|uniref:ABC transporter substrate-binding protein n=1 Tax=Salipaludibacillus sp. CF4.18 TaxID=3373081 RepID=UPI003EE78292